MAALTWPASLLAAASVIDHPWCVCLNRSAEVGKHLAQVLRSRQQVRRRLCNRLFFLLLHPVVFRHPVKKKTSDCVTNIGNISIVSMWDLVFCYRRYPALVLRCVFLLMFEGEATSQPDWIQPGCQSYLLLSAGARK